MKKTILLILSLCLIAIATAQTTLSVVSTAGGLSTAITTAGGNPSTITNLTVTGTIDARDFSTMASLYYLSVIDLSGATIASYTGAGSVYPANGIPINAFYQCGRLTSVIIPSSVTSIGGGAFYECEDFTSINIPSSVTYIGDEAFDGCTALTSVTFSIPSSLTSIGYKTFMDCSLTSVTIPSSVTSIGNDAFVYCNGLITVDANNPNYSSADGVLFNKAKTTLIQCPISKTGSYVIPSSVDSIGNYAFYWCTNLTSITFPSALTSIGFGAFVACSSLTSVTIPASVTYIGQAAFDECSALTSIYAYPTTPVDLTSSYGVFDYVTITSGTLYVPANSVSLYKAASIWQNFNIVGMTTTSVNEIQDNISIYPNPVINNFNISGLSAPQTLQLFDLNGKLIFSQQVDNGTVPASFLQTGIYILKIGNFETKIIKK